MARFLRFQTLVWTAVACAIFWLIAWPLIMNAWAAGHWKEVPCALGGEGRYVYQLANISYNSIRRDFWQLGVAHGHNNVIAELVPNATCWVNPRNPDNAVLFLDAPQNWSNAKGRMAAAGMLVVVGFFLARPPRRQAGKAASHV